MSLISGMGVASGPASAMRFSHTRGRMQGSPVQGVNYPSPFFDVAHTYLPVTVKQMFRWCRYYFLTHPLINSVTFKLAEYPITDLIIDHPDEDTAKVWMEYLQDHLRYRAFQVEVGLDTFAYGNAFIGIGFPFEKHLKCQNCGWTERARKCRNQWVFTNYAFRIACPKCKMTGDAIVRDTYIKNPSGIKLIRWNPEDIEIIYNEFTGNYTYFYTIPAVLRNDIIIGRKEIVEEVPQIFIQALKEQKGVVLSPDKLFHFRRPSLATQDRGWGVPLLLPVLKDTYYLQLMKKAQEAILLEHIVPLRVIFPQAASGTSDPFTSINLVDWRDHVAMEIARWRYDCVTPETLIETRDGLCRADEVQQGDELKNHLGTYSAVEKIWRRPLREGERAFKLKVRGLHGMTQVISEGHPFLVRRKKNNGNGHQISPDVKFVRAKNLHAGDYIGYPLPKHVEDKNRKTLDLAEFVSNAASEKWIYIDHQSPEVPEAFEYIEKFGCPTNRQALLEERGWSINQYKIAQMAHREGREMRRLPRHIPFDKELCWVLGLYLAEGNTSPKQVFFALHKDEQEFVDRLDRFFLERFGANGTTSVKTENGIHRIYSSTIAAQLFHGLCEGAATTKRFHPILKQATDRNLAAAIQGYLDGDGCFHEKDGSGKIDVSSASAQLIADLREILLSKGIMSGVQYAPPQEYLIVGKRGWTSGNYKLATYGSGTERLEAWLSGAVLPPAPSRMGVIEDGYVWSRIQEIAEVEAAEVIGFQMSREVSVHLEDDTEAHGTFCLWGLASANTNYIPILPLPIGNQTIGGDGKALLMTAEIREWSEQIIAGMGVPREFIFGGLSYAGSNISMRMLENSFIGYILSHKQLLRFVMQEVADFLDWPMAKGRFKPFKMADDIQRQALLFQMNQSQKLSDTTLLAGLDFSSSEEDKIMERETKSRLEATKKQQLAMAAIQGEAQLIMMKYQAKGQQVQQEAMAQGPAPGEPGGQDAALGNGGGTPGGQTASAPGQLPDGTSPDQTVAPDGSTPAGPMPGTISPGQQFDATVSSRMGLQNKLNGPAMDLQQLAMMEARQIAPMDPVNQQLALQNIKAQSPELADLVLQQLQTIQERKDALTASNAATAKGATSTGVDMRPAPNVLPPRRSASSI